MRSEHLHADCVHVINAQLGSAQAIPFFVHRWWMLCRLPQHGWPLEHKHAHKQRHIFSQTYTLHKHWDCKLSNINIKPKDINMMRWHINKNNHERDTIGPGLCRCQCLCLWIWMFMWMCDCACVRVCLLLRYSILNEKIDDIIVWKYRKEISLVGHLR